MKAIENVRKQLSRIPVGRPFPSASLRLFASTDNVRQILNRMAKEGQVTRVARGIYVKTKHTKKVGEVFPSASEVAETLASSTGEIIGVHGAEAARQLQLTTQVPMKIIFYTSGNSRTLKIANRTVRLKHVNPSRLIAPGTIAGLVVSALGYLGRENVTIETIEKIKHQISPKEFEQTLKLIEKMPAWMSNVFYHFQQGRHK